VICVGFLDAEKIETTASADGTRLYQTHILEAGDKDYDRLEKSVLEFDTEKKLLSIDQFYQEKFSEQNGIEHQRQTFTPEGKVWNYLIYFTPTKAMISGVDSIVEFTDENDRTTRIEYYRKDRFLFAERNVDILNRFPFYRIEFVQKVMFEDFSDRPGATDLGMSMKYVSGRSVVQFIGTPVDIEQKDAEFIAYYFKSRNAERMIPLYTKKIEVDEDGKRYFVLMQDGLLQYIKDQNWGAVYYYIGVIDDKLELVSVGFNDVDFKKVKS
jgi:hypothetical protein